MERLTATPGLELAAAHLAAVRSGTWVEPITATRTPFTSNLAGAKASSASRPIPTTGIGLAARAASVSARPTGP